LPNADSAHPYARYIREIYSLAFFNQRQALIDMQKLIAEPGAG